MILLAMLYILIKYFPGGSYLFMNSTTRIIENIPPTTNGYKYSFCKVLGFIATEGGGSTDPNEPFLSHLSGFFLMYIYLLVLFPVYLPGI